MLHVDSIIFQRGKPTSRPFTFTTTIQVGLFFHSGSGMPLFDTAHFPTQPHAYMDGRDLTIYNSLEMTLTQYVQMWRAVHWRHK